MHTSPKIRNVDAVFLNISSADTGTGVLHCKHSGWGESFWAIAGFIRVDCSFHPSDRRWGLKSVICFHASKGKKALFSKLPSVRPWLKPDSLWIYSEFIYSYQWDEQRGNWCTCGQPDPLRSQGNWLGFVFFQILHLDARPDCAVA